MEHLRVQRIRPNAVVPTRGTPFAAGLDLYAAFELPQEKIIIGCGERKLIPLGIKIAIHPSFYGRIAPRSGIALKDWVDAVAGVIDCDYRGEVHAMLHNHHPHKHFVVTNGMRVSQLILERVSLDTPLEVDSLDETGRGGNGYGSTGMMTLNVLSAP